MNKYLYFLIIILFPFLSNAQHNYMIKNDVKSTGTKLVDLGDKMNSLYCHIKLGTKIVRYTPKDVIEYGFEDGRVYKSMDISVSGKTKKVFLERLIDGKTALYYYVSNDFKAFFIKNENQALIHVPISKAPGDIANLNQVLKEINPQCFEKKIKINQIRLNKNYIKNLFLSYNTCKSEPSSFVKYGLVLGHSASKFHFSSEHNTNVPTIGLKPVDNYINEMSFEYSGGISFGIFLEKPIPKSNFSFNTAIYYSQNKYTKILPVIIHENQTEIKYESAFFTDVDYSDIVTTKANIAFTSNLSSIYIPILMKYTFSGNKVKPFINTGGTLGINFKNENYVYHIKGLSPSSSQWVELSAPSFISNQVFGYSLGGGLEFKMSNKNILSFEMRINRLSGLSKSNTMNISQRHFFTTFSF